MTSAIKQRGTHYRKLLLKNKAELLAAGRHEPDLLATSVQSADAVEFAVCSAEQDLLAVTLNLRNHMLRQIDQALERLKEGTYGDCLDCGEPIADNRLRAIPWAHYCLKCQENRNTVSQN